MTEYFTNLQNYCFLVGSAWGFWERILIAFTTLWCLDPYSKYAFFPKQNSKQPLLPKNLFKM